MGIMKRLWLDENDVFKEEVIEPEDLKPQIGRVLSENDAFCPSCGHNRDKSSVSSINHGDFHSCQKCGAVWKEV